MKRWLWLVVLCLMLPAYPCHAQSRPGNLLPNPALAPSPISKELPADWRAGPNLGPSSRLAAYGYSKLHGSPALALTGSGDGTGYWACRVEGIKPHTTYRLSLYVSRERTINRMFPEVAFLGQRSLLNQVWRAGLPYPVTLYFDSGERSGPQVLRLINQYPLTVTFSHPSLVEMPAGRPKPGPCHPPVAAPKSFPLGIYGAKPEDFARVAQAGLDTVVTGPAPKDIAAAHEAGLSCLITAPKTQAEWQALKTDLNELGVSLGAGDGFYIDDEPELRAVPPDKLERRRQWAAQYFPGLTTAMAMVRPQCVTGYYCGADVFMMDQYPIPNMPFTWLSGSIDQARELAGPGRIWAVVQAFGGGKWENSGWPRMPTGAEMRNLCFLSLVHGARGIFFFNYKAVKEKPHWNEMARLIPEVKKAFSLLRDANNSSRLPVQVLSQFKADALGKPAVHSAIWRREKSALLVAVNLLRQPVKAQISGLPLGSGPAHDIFSRKTVAIFNGKLVLEFSPLEVKVFGIGPRWL